MSSTTSSNRPRVRQGVARRLPRETDRREAAAEALHPAAAPWTPPHGAAADLAAESVSPLLAAPAPAAQSSGERPLRLTLGREGDHLAVFHLLQTARLAPTLAEFQSQQDEPDYLPAQRLLVKDGPRLVGHVRLAPLDMHCGPSPASAVELTHLAAAPEYAESGLDAALLAAAERTARDAGRLLAVARAPQPAPFLNAGWAPLPRGRYALSAARDVLSALRAREALLPRTPLSQPPVYRIRCWRHVEQQALQRIFAQATAGRWGPRVRGDEYWRWLISRQTCDRIYIAIDGDDQLDLAVCDHIVAYAVLRQHRLVELLADPRHPLAGEQLLARACGDCIEQGAHALRLDAAADDVHWQVFPADSICPLARGERDDMLLAKLLDPRAFLQRLLPELPERLRATDPPVPAKLGLHVAGEKYLVECTPREATLATGRLGRHHLTLPLAGMTQLLLGQLDLPRAAAAGWLTASSPAALHLAEALFPRRPFWRPTWDDLET